MFPWYLILQKQLTRKIREINPMRNLRNLHVILQEKSGYIHSEGIKIILAVQLKISVVKGSRILHASMFLTCMSSNTAWVPN